MFKRGLSISVLFVLCVLSSSGASVCMYVHVRDGTACTRTAGRAVPARLVLLLFRGSGYIWIWSLRSHDLLLHYDYITIF